MANFDAGVDFYTIGNLDINISFPGDEVMCKWCPFLSHSEALDRDTCRVTGQTLYSRKTVGRDCPIVIINTTEEVTKK